MHRTTINVPKDVFRRAKIKALRENIAVSEVIRDLLARWVSDEIKLSPQERSLEERIELARSAGGMWADRDPDAYMVASRIGLKERDKALTNARLDA